MEHRFAIVRGKTPAVPVIRRAGLLHKTAYGNPWGATR